MITKLNRHKRLGALVMVTAISGLVSPTLAADSIKVTAFNYVRAESDNQMASYVQQAMLLLVVLRYYANRDAVLRSPSFASTLWILGGVLCILVLGNLAQIGIWASVFRLAGEFPDFTAAFYHSAVNFATLGYGDLVMSERFRLLGALEAINGVLMIGVSTAVLMSAFQDAIGKTADARREVSPP